MSIPFSVSSGNADSVAIYLRKSLGIVLAGDAELHMAAEMPLRIGDAVPAATMTTAIAGSALSTADQVKITAVVSKKKMTK
jgi:uncharacterized membrane protein